MIQDVNIGAFGVDGFIAEGPYELNKIEQQDLKIWLRADDMLFDDRVYEVYDRAENIRFSKPISSASMPFSPKTYRGNSEALGDGFGSIISDGDLDTREKFKLLHDGSNFSLYIVVKTNQNSTQFIFGNANSAATERGCDALFSSNNPPRFNFRRYKASAGELTSISLVDIAVKLGQYRIYCITHESAVTYGYNQNNTLLTSQSDLGIPNILPPISAFGIGSVRGAGPYLIGGFLELMIFSKAHNQDERNHNLNYLKTKYDLS